MLRQLAAVSRWIESPKACGQFFTKDATAVPRTFLADYSGTCLYVDDIAVAPTAVAVDSAANGTFSTAVTGYELRRNGRLNPDKGPEPKPWNEIELPAYAVGATYVSRGQRWRVTAQWGWPAVPEAVRQACIHLTAILRIQSPRATTSVDQMGTVIGMSPQARDIVAELLKAYPRVPVVA